MKNNYKYLNDGRKVSIIGKLNNQETIVQEIFVTKDGTEIPSGENFTVKSIHNEPVISWKEKEEITLEERKNKLKKDIKTYEMKEDRLYEEIKGYCAVLKSCEQLVSNLKKNEINNFVSFLTGTTEYLVVDDYRIKPPVRLIDEVIKFERGYDNYRYESIKLLSVLGRSEGNIEYRINEYSDGSGSSNRVYPFSNKKDAVRKIKEMAISRILNNRLSIDEYKICVELGIKFCKEHKSTLKTQLNSSNKVNAIRIKEDITKQQKRLIELSKEQINELPCKCEKESKN